MIEHLQKELADKGAVSFYVRARPGAPKSEIRSVHEDESLKVDLAAAPEDGKANTELVSVLASEFAVAKTAVQIVSGKTARIKLVRITR